MTAYRAAAKERREEAIFFSNLKMGDEVEEFKRAKETLSRLRNHPKIQEWIQVEGKRRVDEYAAHVASVQRERYAVLTQDDIDWLLTITEGEYRELHLLVPEGAKDRVPTQVMRSVNQNKGERQAIKLDCTILTTLTYSGFMPHEMTHLWGGGYAAMLGI